MNSRIPGLMERLAGQVDSLPAPIHVIAICSGGRTVARHILAHLKKRRVTCTYHEVWTNIVGHRAEIWKTDFSKRDYRGTALIVEDVIWRGTSFLAVKRWLQKIKRKRVYSAVLLDLNHKADFAVFR